VNGDVVEEGNGVEDSDGVEDGGGVEDSERLPTGTKALCPMATLYCPYDMVFQANEKSIFEFFTQPKFSLSSEPPD